MQRPACFQTFAVVTHRPEEWSLDIITMPGKIEIVTNALRCLRVNGQTPLLAAFAHDLQGIESAIHVEVPDFQARDLRAAKPDLQTDGQHGAVTNTKQRTWIWLIKNGPGLRLRKRECHPLSAVHHRPLDVTHGIHVYDIKLHEVRK